MGQSRIILILCLNQRSVSGFGSVNFGLPGSVIIFTILQNVMLINSVCIFSPFGHQKGIICLHENFLAVMFDV
jgi:hypothetical protein